ncbi:MAG TPA: glycine cleavage system aminomethyltransferase GcvT [Clostridiales bacterium]|jgi:aminomethyltransferase|nr:glycine cleavage system aminomethyltransferase GcvT [Clostridiales bacterium]
MDSLKKTPLYDTHVKLGGKMVDFGGWALPVQYSSILEEHKAVRERAGLFDVSHMGEIFVEGKDAFSFLQHMVTNDLTSMTENRCRYSPMCYENGGTVDDILVYKFSDTRYLLVVNASNTDKDYEWLVKNSAGFDVKLENQSASWAQLALQGPKFMEVLNKLNVEGEIPAKNYTFNPEIKLNSVPCLVSRTGYTGEDGVEIYCKAEYGERIHEMLMEAGKDIGMLPCGLGARDTLRFEASMPLYGHEITADITPKEAGLGFAIKLNKEEFIGKEALMEEPKRVRIGLKLIDKGIAREHYDVYVGDKLVGFTTSGGIAPTVGGNLAMALVCTCVKDEQIFEIEVRNKRLKAEKVALPFYKR